MKFTGMVLVLVMLLFVSSCGDDEGGNNGIVEITVKSEPLAEQNGDNAEYELVASFSGTNSSAFNLNYHTEDLTAKAGIDYVGVTGGTINVPAGSNQIGIPITIISDSHFELRESFKIIIESSENYTLSNAEVFVPITNDDAVDDNDILEDADGFYTPEVYPSMELIWGEEFDGTELDVSSWNYDLGDGCPDLCGWGNNELEWYTDLPENITQMDGKLVITALENESSPTYTSAKITSAGKKEFKFGRIDIRAKLPEGQGIWPALWMLGSNIGTVGWPQCGEIDIMELVGHIPDQSHGTVHFQGSGGYEFSTKEYNNPSGDFKDQYHVFTLIWDLNSVKWYVDYNLFNSITNTSISGYPFNNEFYFIVNLAVGGNWPGSPDVTTVFPQTLEVDYIRVFQ